MFQNFFSDEVVNEIVTRQQQQQKKIRENLKIKKCSSFAGTEQVEVFSAEIRQKKQIRYDLGFCDLWAE